MFWNKKEKKLELQVEELKLENEVLRADIENLQDLISNPVAASVSSAGREGDLQDLPEDDFQKILQNSNQLLDLIRSETHSLVAVAGSLRSLKDFLLDVVNRLEVKMPTTVTKVTKIVKKQKTKPKKKSKVKRTKA